MAVDIARPDLLEKKRKRRLVWTGVGAVAVVLATVGVSRLKPAAPAVERATLVIDAVKRGEMVREVRGLGTLVPEDIRWIAARHRGARRATGAAAGQDGGRERRDPRAQQPRARDAGARGRVAGARRRGALHRARGAAREPAPRPEGRGGARGVRVDARRGCRPTPTAELAKNGLVAGLTAKLSKSAADELDNRQKIEQQRLGIAGKAIEAQLRVQQAEVEQRQAQARLRRSQVDALQVRAGIDGVLQQVPVEVGQRVTPGTNLARVARPDKLKAVIRVPETQARDVVPGQKAVGRHAQRHRGRDRGARRPRGAEWHRHRRPRAGGRAAERRAARPHGRRHDRAGAAGERDARRPPGARPAADAASRCSAWSRARTRRCA